MSRRPPQKQVSRQSSVGFEARYGPRLSAVVKKLRSWTLDPNKTLK